MEIFEPETEVHRTQKAVKQLLGQSEYTSNVVFPESSVSIRVPESVVEKPGGQLAVMLMVNLLARMKSLIQNVGIAIPPGVTRHSQIPLQGNDFREGLELLVGSLTGSHSEYSVSFDFNTPIDQPAVSLAMKGAVDNEEATDIVIGADAWTAYVNHPLGHVDWSTQVPVGPYMAATFAIAEIFKHLLLLNFPEQADRPISLLNDLEFCALTYGPTPQHIRYPNLGNETPLAGLAIAGLGAGGSATLFTLASFPNLVGDITLIEPGRHKLSSLGRYLLSTYDDCTCRSSKLMVARDFVSERHPILTVRSEECFYQDVQQRDFRLVVSTVDSPEARWSIQRDYPPVILDGAVVESIYALLRVYPGEGMCLGCKHPHDPDVTWKRRASTWGQPVDEIRRLYLDKEPVSEDHITRLAEVQGRSTDEFQELLGISFNEIPSITECGTSKFNLRVPSQAATLPFVTTMVGVLLAAEVIKDLYVQDRLLRNWFDHDMLWFPKPHRHKLRPSVPDCPFCSKANTTLGVLE